MLVFINHSRLYKAQPVDFKNKLQPAIQGGFAADQVKTGTAAS